MTIDYIVNPTLTTDGFIDLLNRSTLGVRRPVDDEECIRGMLNHANLVVAAYEDKKLVGIARCVTDFHYCCYLSDLAVDEAYQKRGIGLELIRHTQMKIGLKCKIILLSAPAAVDYYPHIGFEQHPQAWVLKQPVASMRKK